MNDFATILGMQTIRSFISIPLAADVSRAAVKIMRRLGSEGDGIKWVPEENFHLTLKFLGEVDNTVVPDICNVLDDICQQHEPFELSFAGTGAFPDLQRPRILYIGVQDESGTLVKLVAALETELAELGFKPEPRDYTPHLTLGRTKRGRKLNEELVSALQAEQGTHVGDMTVDTVQLMSSFLDKSGPTYQAMDTIDLGST